MQTLKMAEETGGGRGFKVLLSRQLPSANCDAARACRCTRLCASTSMVIVLNTVLTLQSRRPVMMEVRRIQINRQARKRIQTLDKTWFMPECKLSKILNIWWKSLDLITMHMGQQYHKYSVS